MISVFFVLFSLFSSAFAADPVVTTRAGFTFAASVGGQGPAMLATTPRGYAPPWHRMSSSDISLGFVLRGEMESAGKFSQLAIEPLLDRHGLGVRVEFAKGRTFDEFFELGIGGAVMAVGWSPKVWASFAEFCVPVGIDLGNGGIVVTVEPYVGLGVAEDEGYLDPVFVGRGGARLRFLAFQR